MSLIVSVVVVLLAYPVAYYLALSGTKRKYVLLLILIAPFLTSYLLRVLAWKVILGNNGVFNSFLVWAGIRSADHPVSQLLYSRFAVMLVLAYVWVPFVASRSSCRSTRRPSSARSSVRSRGEPPAGVPARDAPAQPPRCRGRVPLRLHPDGRRVRHAVARGRTSGYMYGNQIATCSDRLPDWETGSVLALFLLGVVAVLTVSSRASRRCGGRLMDVALSRERPRAVARSSSRSSCFLYAPIAILLLFSFNDSRVPRFR
jgi:spermidine/putrescine transport system permease protein